MPTDPAARHAARPAPPEPAGPARWLPEGKRAAVCVSVDDVHPATSRHPYEAGGDLDRGVLGRLAWLLERHPSLRLTLFATPDWREISPAPTRRLLARVPGVRDRVYLAPVWPKGTMRLDRHPALVDYLRSLPRTEVALHGLHHVHPGPRIPIEFQAQGVDECVAMLEAGVEIFRAAGLSRPAGMCPPGFSTPPALLAAMARVGFSYVASSRDIFTAVEPDALAAMSGLRGVPLYRPALVEGGRMAHLPTNWQATSTPERAFAIVEAGGLLSIKGHAIKDAMGHVALDGVDDLYRNYLDLLFRELDRRYGQSLWWATMAEVADAVRGAGETAEGHAVAAGAAEAR